MTSTWNLWLVTCDFGFGLWLWLVNCDFDLWLWLVALTLTYVSQCRVATSNFFETCGFFDLWLVTLTLACDLWLVTCDLWLWLVTFDFDLTCDFDLWVWVDFDLWLWLWLWLVTLTLTYVSQRTVATSNFVPYHWSHTWFYFVITSFRTVLVVLRSERLVVREFSLRLIL